MQSKIILIVIVLAVLGIGFYLISKPSASPAPVPAEPSVRETSVTETGETEEMEEEVVEVKVFQISGGAFYFDPAEIKVTEGDKVKIVFTNEGGTHDFTLDEFNVKTSILEETGATAEVEFVADKAGTYEYYCSVGDHRERGMVGTLVVEPKL